MTGLWCGGAAAEFIRFIAKINSNHQSLLQFNAPWRVETKIYIFNFLLGNYDENWHITAGCPQCPPNLVTSPGPDQRQEALLQPSVE